jgi:anti-sigma B factor antagonist
MAMQVNREEIADAIVLTVQGSVDITSSPELRGELKAALDRRIPRIVVDMGEVTFVDSSGLATLIEALQRTQVYEGRVVLCNLSQAVLGVFELANLDHIFQIRPSRQAALEG